MGILRYNNTFQNGFNGAQGNAAAQSAILSSPSQVSHVVSSLLDPRLNWKFWQRHLKDRPKSLFCALRGEDRGAMSEDTRVHPCSSLLDDRGSLSAQRSGMKTAIKTQLEHLNEVAEKHFKCQWPIFTSFSAMD